MPAAQPPQLLAATDALKAKERDEELKANMQAEETIKYLKNVVLQYMAQPAMAQQVALPVRPL